MHKNLYEYKNGSKHRDRQGPVKLLSINIKKHIQLILLPSGINQYLDLLMIINVLC